MKKEKIILFCAVLLMLCPISVSAKEKKQNFAGWQGSSKKNVNATYGKVSLKGKVKRGSFLISIVDDSNVEHPVFSTGNEFANSSFYLRVNRGIYKLTGALNVENAVRLTDDGMEVAYGVPDVATVTVNFKCMNTVPDVTSDLIKVSATVTNVGKRAGMFSLKAVLDTILGETEQYHFYLEDDYPIKGESFYRTGKMEKMVISKNEDVTAQFLFEGGDITSPEMLCLANFRTLDQGLWEPNVSNRSFDTVTSYNNSALGIIWPEKLLKINESTTYVFYIAVESNNRKPKGLNYIYKIPVPKEVQEEAAAPTVVEKTEEEKDPLVKEINIEVVEDVAANDRIVPNVKFDVESLTNEQLTPEYIQDLLDRIADLEETDSILNRNEILQLNAELDAILESLK